MGEIHRLIEETGIDFVRAQSEDKLQRQVAETAFGVMSDEERQYGIMHAGFAMTSLPHKDISEPTWSRHGGNIKLLVESGRDASENLVGIPFGTIARMILFYFQTEAVKNRSREIELGRSMNQWLAGMGIDNGGKTYKLVREQSKRLSLCKLTFFRMEKNQTTSTNGGFVRDAILPTADEEDDQMTLWRSAVRLDEGFYESLIEHGMPVRTAAIREIGARSMAIDVYIWLAYRLHYLTKATPVTWAALYSQFGGGYQHIRQFKAKFKEPLSLALAAYPEARVDVSDTGVVLHPSPPPVPERMIAAG